MVDETVNIVSGGGSPVMEIQVGACYHLYGRPGVFAVVQFNSAEEVLVMEMSTKVQEEVAVAYLRLIQSSDNTREFDLKLIGSKKFEEAQKILDAIKPLLEYRRLPAAVVEARAKETGKSAKTLKKWLRRYRKDPRLSTLTRKRRKDAGETRFEPLVEKEVEKAINALLLDANLLLTDALEDLEDAVKALSKKLGRELEAPSYGTLWARYHLVSEKQKAEAKFGKRPARLTHGLKSGTLSDVDHPLALVQVDHLEVPVVVVDEEFREPIGKAWITVLIDVFSRCVVGYYLTLESPGNLSLGLAMSHAILPKNETLKLLGQSFKWPISGFMWTIHADNAGEFHGNMLELAANEYVVDLMFRKVREPNYGAYIESYLGTLSEQLRRVPGSTREGPEALGETDPYEEAVMTLAELEKYILSLIMTYHNNPHSGLQKQTPLGRFQEGMRGGPGIIPVGRIRQAANQEKLRLDFMPVDERIVHPKGIVWDYIWYNDDCLQRWVNALDPDNKDEKRKFLVRRDPRDLSRIYFWDPEEKRYRVIRTKNLARPSITLWELNALRKYLEDRGAENIDEDMLFEAREDRRKMREDAKIKTEAARRRAAREAERERHAKKGAEATAKAVAPLPSPPVPPKENVDTVGKPYTMDWGD